MTRVSAAMTAGKKDAEEVINPASNRNRLNWSSSIPVDVKTSPK